MGIPISHCSDKLTVTATGLLENGLQPPAPAHKWLNGHFMVTGDTLQVWAGDQRGKGFLCLSESLQHSDLQSGASSDLNDH